MNLTFTKIEHADLKKSDKKGLSTLYLYWLSEGKKESFDIPLFINDDGKGVLSVECFKRVFFAFQCMVNHFCSADIVSGSDGDESSYNVIRITVNTETLFNDDFAFTRHFADYEEPKKTDLKRESSAKTQAKSEAKKAEAEAKKAEIEEKLDTDWNKKAIKELSKYLVSRFKIKPMELNKIEDDMLKILNNIK